MIYHKYGPLPKKTAKHKRERRLLELARSRAKKSKMVFDITQEDVSIPDNCPVLGITLSLEKAKGFSDNSPTLDRVDNSLGYEKGNVLVISWRANRLKCDATVEELQTLSKFYTKWRAQ